MAVGCNLDLTPYKVGKSKNDTFVFDGDDCIVKSLEFLLKFKVAHRKVNIRVVAYVVQLHAHNGSGFDTWIFLNNLPCEKLIVDIIKNEKSTISLKVFNGCIQNCKEQIPQNSIFRCGLTHLK